MSESAMLRDSCASYLGPSSPSGQRQSTVLQHKGKQTSEYGFTDIRQQLTETRGAAQKSCSGGLELKEEDCICTSYNPQCKQSERSIMSFCWKLFTTCWIVSVHRSRLIRPFQRKTQIGIQATVSVIYCTTLMRHWFLWSACDSVTSPPVHNVN